MYFDWKLNRRQRLLADGNFCFADGGGSGEGGGGGGGGERGSGAGSEPQNKPPPAADPALQSALEENRNLKARLESLESAADETKRKAKAKKAAEDGKLQEELEAEAARRKEAEDTIKRYRERWAKEADDMVAEFPEASKKKCEVLKGKLDVSDYLDFVRAEKASLGEAGGDGDLKADPNSNDPPPTSLSMEPGARRPAQDKRLTEANKQVVMDKLGVEFQHQDKVKEGRSKDGWRTLSMTLADWRKHRPSPVPMHGSPKSPRNKG